ncbi:sigma 54-interacting transcriptional regulator [Polyangium sp. 6x1]|uniref:sigma 54-interacting transcriptional regulator n=1 Tax=Polyangium sp. 6x1 TaxID=3042689 RepID=UPI0024825EB1|nr:sigma 54-interacting transcriptional regulator [Polyangium sp. 6x1]MDI1442468.1 sigma 54-interacting transcriptional regulator [Polyangium sp. 6x1]
MPIGSDDPTRQTYDGSTTRDGASGPITAVMLTILCHPDVERIGERAVLAKLNVGREVVLSREEPPFTPPTRPAARPLADACVSRTPIRLAPLPGGGVRVNVVESRTSVVHRGSTVEGALDLSGEDLRRGAVLLLGGRIVLLIHRVEVFDTPENETLGLLGDSPGIHLVRREIRTVADQDRPVLLRGETGTGKDLAARAIHQAGPRRDGPFVVVNLAAVPPTLASAELFGVERGAFTGAVRERQGYFNAARGGTLFLDEIGEAPPDVQVMLLRAIESGEAQVVGAGRVHKVDVRILAATDADLEAKVRDGSFRAPLLHRLATLEIRMPPLRERRDDIGRLLLGFLREELEAIGEGHRLTSRAPDGRPWLSASLVARLADGDWPGNVRQLRNVVHQIVLGSRGQDRMTVGPAVERLLHEPASALAASAPDRVPAAASEPLSSRRKPSEITEAELEAALHASRWDLLAAASQLQITRASIYVLIERSKRFRTAGDLTVDEITSCHRACGGDVARMVERLEVSEKALRRRLRELGLDPRR